MLPINGTVARSKAVRNHVKLCRSKAFSVNGRCLGLNLFLARNISTILCVCLASCSVVQLSKKASTFLPKCVSQLWPVIYLSLQFNFVEVDRGSD